MYEAYEKGMNEIVSIFKQRLVQKEEMMSFKEKQKQETLKQISHKKRIKEFDNYLNVQRMKRKNDYERTELESKLNDYKFKIDEFMREK